MREWWWIYYCFGVFILNVNFELYYVGVYLVYSDGCNVWFGEEDF